MSIDAIVEERKVVTQTRRKKRIDHFLHPIISINSPPPARPAKPTSSISSIHTYLNKVKFIGWFSPQQKWEDWVKTMKAAHSPGWKMAGIHDAIMNSTLKIPQNKSLIFWFAEKWSPKTNTFILPWGEVTITLEDMMVLGGLSVLGGPVTSHVESPQDCDALSQLNNVYVKLIKSPSKKASSNAWMTEFKNNQNVHEHEAFIALWLSKYLFPSVKDTVLPDTFALAIHLARGRKMALAPAVLATLYRDLHLLQNTILDLQQGETEGVLQQVCSPMCYIQVWVLERFPCVRPDHGMLDIRDDETRLARWAKLVQKSTDYATLEVSKLVGLDISQQYFPHRVHKQFGYNQDIPADVIHLESNEDAWADYATPLENEYIYLPSRQFEGHVTVRYEKWWKSEPIAIHQDNRVQNHCEEEDQEGNNSLEIETLPLFPIFMVALSSGSSRGRGAETELRPSRERAEAKDRDQKLIDQAPFPQPTTTQDRDRSPFPQAKSTVVCRQGSRSLAGLRDLMMESSATREYPSLIHTFFVTYTVGGVFTRDEDRAIYEEMLRLQGLGSNTPSGVPYTKEEINSLARKGKQRGHLPGVDRVLLRRAIDVLSPPQPQCTHNSADVEKLKKKNKHLTKHFGNASGSDGCGDDEMADDEDGGEDEADEEDGAS
ncbi:serine/threonine-protein phosphatase 7 long form-like protein [Tanacetum coccineum]